MSTAAGITVTVTVTDKTEISWYHRSAACPNPATIADLTVDRMVHKLKTSDDSDHENDNATAITPRTEEISLAC